MEKSKYIDSPKGEKKKGEGAASRWSALPLTLFRVDVLRSTTLRLRFRP